MRKIRALRILLATFFLLAVTACFLDFTGAAARWFGWTVKLQLMPAALALGASAVAIVVVTLLFGRVYCSVVCPLGLLQDVAIFFRRVAVRLFLRRRAAAGARGVSPVACGGARLRNMVRYAIAAVFFAGGFLGLHFSWLEPYAIYGRMAASLAAPAVRHGNNQLALWAERHGSYMFQAVEVVMPPLCMVVVSAALLALILVLAVWKGRFWCNTVCPVGTVLGCISRVSLLRPKIDPAKCVRCGLCEKACKAQSIDVASGKIDLTTCVACFDCGAACGKGALKWSR